MKNKIIISIIIFFMLIIPLNVISYSIDIEPIDPTKNGCLENNNLELFFEESVNKDDLTKKIFKVSNNDLILSLIENINEELYLGYLENLTAFGPRVTTSQACDDSAKYIYNEFKKLNLEARYHNWSNDYLFGSNIEATLPGIQQENEEIYIICAHYDTVEGSPGADDDGSGVAAVLTAANVMSAFSFNHTIKFVAFSGEEQGLYGSAYYVQEAVENYDNIIAALNADMIGFAISQQDESILEIYENDESEWLADFAVEVSEEYYEYFNLAIMRSGYTWGSDHYRFWEAGYDAIFYAEYNFNDFYHSPEDTIENMNIPYATRASKLIITTLAELSEIFGAKNAPSKPDTPSGASNGKIGQEYYYSTSSTDLDGDIIYYLWDWGDNTNDEWIGPFNSGEVINISHTWETKGDYSIKVKAKDEDNFESDWSDPLVVSMPRNYINIKEYISQIIEKYNFLSLLNRLLINIK